MNFLYITNAHINRIYSFILVINSFFISTIMFDVGINKKATNSIKAPMANNAQNIQVAVRCR